MNSKKNYNTYQTKNKTQNKIYIWKIHILKLNQYRNPKCIKSQIVTP
jgi:hypothetical protein